mmetsp:Transcript_37574/g.62216  ORF Transcript_37574/g.62216 Transcript_37574/m.62216 type:complete len:206 (+) Transcript_37574:511-1128(+)
MRLLLLQWLCFLGQAQQNPLHRPDLLHCAVREFKVFSSEFGVGKVVIALDPGAYVIGAQRRPCPTCAVCWCDHLYKIRSVLQHKMVYNVELREQLVGPFPTLGVAGVVVSHDASKRLVVTTCHMLAERRENLPRVKKRGGHTAIVVDVAAAAKCMVGANLPYVGGLPWLSAKRNTIHLVLPPIHEAFVLPSRYHQVGLEDQDPGR